MADRALIFGKLCQIDTITIDACRDESHQLSNTVTDHPVEEGFNATDHSRPDPDQVTLQCFVSNTPLSVAQQNLANKDVPGSAQTNADGSVKIAQVPSRGPATFEKLKKLRDEGTLIKVVTTLKTYGVSSTEGMMITSLNISRTSKNYDGLEFTITLKQIRIVRNKQTRDVKSKDKRVGQKKKDGSQTTGPAAQEESALSKLADSASQSSNGTIKGLGNFLLSGGSGGVSQ